MVFLLKRACIVNVGVNASHQSLKSPLFADQTFEFVPIPEEGRRVSAPECPLLETYATLKSFTGVPFTSFVPRAFHEKRVHNDPEFEHFTYGDYPSSSPRASNLRRLSEGDYVVFFARLEGFSDHFEENVGFYFIGYFEIEKIYPDLIKAPTETVLREIGSNAHVKRALWNIRYWNGFWVFKGSTNSRRFRKAVPITVRMMKDVGLIPGEEKGLGGTENQILGSYLRAARLVESSKTSKLVDNFLNQ
jgi:hypothetical protein